MSTLRRKRPNPLQIQKAPSKATTVAHMDDWLMTYSDMITLLLCFFAVFLSVNIPKKEAAEPSHKTEQIALAGSSETFQGNLPLHTLLERKAMSDRHDDRPRPEESTSTDDSAPVQKHPALTPDEERELYDMLSQLKAGQFGDYIATVDVQNDVLVPPRVVITLEKPAQ